MFEGSMRSTGWGCVGSQKSGFEWRFTPDSNDPAYCVDPFTGQLYSFCFCQSGYIFQVEKEAIKDGKRWMKKAGRSGTIEAVKAEPRHFEY